MKVTYSKPKGERIKKQFYGLEWNIWTGHILKDSYTWCKELDKWYKWDERMELFDEGFSQARLNSSIKTLKSVVRHIKKHSKYLPKGTQFILVSKYVGYDIYITI